MTNPPTPLSPPIGPTYKEIVPVTALTTLIDTSLLFGGDETSSDASPIDQFINNTSNINRIYLSHSGIAGPFPKELGALVVLGYMSAFESYLRALIRAVINVDQHARSLVEKLPVSFAAAMYHRIDLLPEALFEDTSFASDKNVLDALRELLGVGGEAPADVKLLLAEYRKICEIRHCCVHRFGKLGSKNASSLGLDTHHPSLEKQLNASISDLESISDVLVTCAKTINNYVFSSIMLRTARLKDYKQNIAKYDARWSGDYTEDRERFSKYYRIFSVTAQQPFSRPEEEIYGDFNMTCLAAQHTAINRRGQQ